MESHLSSSKVQKEIELKIIEKLKVEFECEFVSKIDEYTFQPDFYNKEKRIIGEIYSGIDKLNSAQRNKIMADCFKLLSIEKCLEGEWNKIIIIIDSNIKNELEVEKTWRKIAMDKSNIKLKLEVISSDDLAKLRIAKTGQRIGMTIPKPKK